MDPLSIMIITYERTETAVRTIQALQRNLDCDPKKLYFHIADDGSSKQHIRTLIGTINSFCPNKPTVTNSLRKGVGVSMNMGQQVCFRRTEQLLWLEDDWELVHRINPELYMNVLNNNPEVGMIRLGYISPGIQGELQSYEGRLWWRLRKGPTYTFAGHASLRHNRFYRAHGKYPTTLAPGETELYMCGTFNNVRGPEVVIPAFTGEWGIFAHIGSNSLKDIRPQ